MYKKLLFFSDAAVIPRPTLEQFEAMLRYDLEVCRRMGIEAPRVALIHCTEKVNEKFPHTLDYVTLKEVPPPVLTETCTWTGPWM